LASGQSVATTMYPNAAPTNVSPYYKQGFSPGGYHYERKVS